MHDFGNISYPWDTPAISTPSFNAMSHPYPLIDATNLVPGSRVCVAISGGADSVALLCALDAANKLYKEPLGIGLSAVHVHHGLRADEADADASFVHDLCTRLEIPLSIHRVSVPAYRKANNETMEEAARNLRYNIFRAILTDNTADDLLTAHTLDDQAETVLMKLLRGAWTEGLGGIHPILFPLKSPAKRILRPMLDTSRAQIAAYLRKLGQPWREDSSNLDLSHTRNRLRHRILPILRAENPSVDRTLANLSELAREEETRWETELSRILPQILLPGSPVRGGGRSVSTATDTPSVALDIDRLRSLDNPTRRRILRAAARSLRAPEDSASDAIRLSFDETGRLLALCGLITDPTVSPRPGAVLSLSRNLTAKRSVRELKLSLNPKSFPQKLL